MAKIVSSPELNLRVAEDERLCESSGSRNRPVPAWSSESSSTTSRLSEDSGSLSSSSSYESVSGPLSDVLRLDSARELPQRYQNAVAFERSPYKRDVNGMLPVLPGQKRRGRIFQHKTELLAASIVRKLSSKTDLTPRAPSCSNSSTSLLVTSARDRETFGASVAESKLMLPSSQAQDALPGIAIKPTASCADDVCYSLISSVDVPARPPGLEPCSLATSAVLSGSSIGCLPDRSNTIYPDVEILVPAKRLAVPTMKPADFAPRCPLRSMASVATELLALDEDSDGPPALVIGYLDTSLKVTEDVSCCARDMRTQDFGTVVKSNIFSAFERSSSCLTADNSGLDPLAATFTPSGRFPLVQGRSSVLQVFSNPGYHNYGGSTSHDSFYDVRTASGEPLVTISETSVQTLSNCDVSTESQSSSYRQRDFMLHCGSFDSPEFSMFSPDSVSSNLRSPIVEDLSTAELSGGNLDNGTPCPDDLQIAFHKTIHEAIEAVFKSPVRAGPFSEAPIHLSAASVRSGSNSEQFVTASSGDHFWDKQDNNNFMDNLDPSPLLGGLNSGDGPAHGVRTLMSDSLMQATAREPIYSSKDPLTTRTEATHLAQSIVLSRTLAGCALRIRYPYGSLGKSATTGIITLAVFLQELQCERRSL